MARRDPHSYNDDTQPETESLALRATVDFARKILTAEATLSLKQPGQGPLDLDTRDLTIEAVTGADGQPLAFKLHPPEPIFGARLSVTLPPGTKSLTIRYRTSPEASALQWLDPAQTFGGKEPFLFSQCQAIHARSVAPLQDTPRLRIRYTATLIAPKRLTALMGAAFVSREEKGELAESRFEMPQPIPPYLLAFAVGELASKEIAPRSRVWAEPSVVEKAAWEFGEVDRMLAAGEELFGKYDWDRFDILLMPKSFPYGGMENPRLTFVTPTLLAGDRSLASVVAHELAHSWTGNLVTNSNAEHFWLNEGFTVYAERRMVEKIEGEEIGAVHAALGRRSLDRAIEGFKDHPGLTRLRTHLEGIDPDEAFSQIPYEKGYLFLRAIEESVGRPAFDRFLKSYLKEFRFGAITVDDFLGLAERELPGALAKVGAPEWIDGEGLPANAPRVKSARIEAIEKLGATPPSEEVAKEWTPAEWQLYLESVPAPAPKATCDALEARFHLTASGNFEVLVAWLTLAVKSGEAKVHPRVEEVLGEVGRMKYLKPLYKALMGRAETKALARRCFERFAPRYHPIAKQVIQGVVQGG